MLRAMYTSEVQQFYISVCRQYDLGAATYTRRRHITPNLLIDYVRNGSLEMMSVEVTAEAVLRLQEKTVSVAFLRVAGLPFYDTLQNMGRTRSGIVENATSWSVDQEPVFGTFRGYIQIPRAISGTEPVADYLLIYSPARYRRLYNYDKSVIDDQWLYTRSYPSTPEAKPKMLFTVGDYDVSDRIMDAYTYGSGVTSAQKEFAAHNWLEAPLPDIPQYVLQSTGGAVTWSLAYNHSVGKMPTTFTDGVLTHSDQFTPILSVLP